jgi:hypothetical protein
MFAREKGHVVDLPLDLDVASSRMTDGSLKLNETDRTSRSYTDDFDLPLAPKGDCFLPVDDLQRLVRGVEEERLLHKPMSFCLMGIKGVKGWRGTAAGPIIRRSPMRRVACCRLLSSPWRLPARLREHGRHADGPSRRPHPPAAFRLGRTSRPPMQGARRPLRLGPRGPATASPGPPCPCVAPRTGTAAAIPRGFDCSGFVNTFLVQNGVPIQDARGR